MMISQEEIASAISAYRPAAAQVVPFPARMDVDAHPVWWARAMYDYIPPSRDSIVYALRSRIELGNYFVPADRIVDQLLARLLVQRIVLRGVAGNERFVGELRNSAAG